MVEPESDACYVDEAEEAGCGFVVAGCQPMAVLQLVETPLDHIAQRVDGHVDNRSNLAVLAHRDHRQGVAAFDVLPNFIRIIAPVGDQHSGLWVSVRGRGVISAPSSV